MGSILAFFNLITWLPLTSADIEQALGYVHDNFELGEHIAGLFEQVTGEKLEGYSGVGMTSDYQNPFILMASVYQVLSRLETNPREDTPKIAHIVLIGTPDKPVPLSIVHHVRGVVEAHNRFPHPTKVRVILSDLVDLAVL